MKIEITFRMPVLLILTLVGVVIFFSHTMESITGFRGV